MTGSHALLVNTTRRFYADPRVRAAAFSYADLFLLDPEIMPRTLRVGGPEYLHRLWDGRDLPITASMLTTMQLGPWGNTKGLGMTDQGTPIGNGNFVQPIKKGTAEGMYRSNNPMDRFTCRHGITWVARPTLVPSHHGAKRECTSGHLIGSTFSTGGYRDPEVKGDINTIAVPFLFPADKLDMRLFNRFDEREGNALDAMLTYRSVQSADANARLEQAQECLQHKRKGIKRSPMGIPKELVDNWMGMTPRELANTVNVMKARVKVRKERDRELTKGMALQMEALSKLMIARIPIAYSVLLAQINNLEYGEET